MDKVIYLGKLQILQRPNQSWVQLLEKKNIQQKREEKTNSTHNWPEKQDIDREAKAKRWETKIDLEEHSEAIEFQIQKEMHIRQI